MSAESDPQKEVMKLKGKLNALAAILRLGHEAFEKSNLEQWAVHVVNNSVLVVPYTRSAMVDLRGRWPKVLAVSGQPEVNSNSEYANHLLNLTQPLKDLSKITSLDEKLLEQRNSRQGAFDGLEYLLQYSKAVIAVPVIPSGEEAGAGTLLWIIEFENKRTAGSAPSLLSLLCKHYSESVFFILNDKRKKFISDVIDRRKFFRPSRVIAGVVAVLLIAMFVIRIPQNVAAEFEIVPNQEHIYYAPFDGVIEECLHKSGEKIKKGELILRYNTDERQYNLASAKNAYNKISAQLELVQQQSFKDIRKRGQVRLMEIQKEKTAVEIKKNDWYLKKSNVVAENSGILDIGDADKLEGKAVRSGEKLFEILSTAGENLIALIALDERYASVLTGGNTNVTLYLHAQPEKAITGKILAISPKPVLTERKLYCYLIRFKPQVAEHMMCGMRGVARVTGVKVRLGYYLFRNLVLWWRQV
jgi:hypothetical protein